MQLFTILLTALALASWTTALPLALVPDASRRSDKIVYSPSIKSPNESTVWRTGTKQVVTWDTSSVPKGAEANKGTIMLGYDDNTGSEHLDYRESFLFCSADPARRPCTNHIVVDLFFFYWSVLTCLLLHRTPPG